MNWLNSTKIYIRETRKLRKQYPEVFKYLDVALFFPAWLRSLRVNAGPLIDEAPWVTFAARRFIEDHLTSDMRVFEYGSGGSTLFFAARVAEGVSVEHDPSWANEVAEVIRRRRYGNWQVHLVEPSSSLLSLEDPSDPDAYISQSDKYLAHSFEGYVKSIEEFPDGHFDLILIDGRARPSCFKHAIRKVRVNGYVVWDDTHRPRYLRAMRSAPEMLEFTDFPGPSPYVDRFTRTSVWQS